MIELHININMLVNPIIIMRTRNMRIVGSIMSINIIKYLIMIGKLFILILFINHPIIMEEFPTMSIVIEYHNTIEEQPIVNITQTTIGVHAYTVILILMPLTNVLIDTELTTIDIGGL